MPQTGSITIAMTDPPSGARSLAVPCLLRSIVGSRRRCATATRYPPTSDRAGAPRPARSPDVAVDGNSLARQNWDGSPLPCAKGPSTVMVQPTPTAADGHPALSLVTLCERACAPAPLPQPLASFVGREREVAAILALLR